VISIIIDCHVHLNRYEHTNKPSLEERLTALLDVMITNDIDYSVILSSYEVNVDRPSTAQILDITKKHDNLGVVAGFSIDNHTDEDYRNCRIWLKEGFIKGVKLYCGYEHHYPFDKRYQRVYDMCVEFGVPVMIHTGDTFSNKGKIRFSHPLNIDDVAVDNPDLKIVMCHLGNPYILDCQEILYKNKNVYADISGLVFGSFTSFSKKYIVSKVIELLNYAGEPHYLLYGTDWPISNMSSYLNFVQNLELSSKIRELVMFRNAKNLFRI
jgi:predicted TIM-barrel fold metal-dependent hydrolase